MAVNKDVMNITLALSGVSDKLDQMITLLKAILAKEIDMDATTKAEFDKLTAAVTQQTTVAGSVVTLLNGLSAQIAALKATTTDPTVIAAIDAVLANVNTNTTTLTTAVTANTPA